MSVRNNLFNSFLVLIGHVLFYPIYGQESKLKVFVDERMELLTTVQYLSDYQLIAYAKSSYKSDIDTYFVNFKNHPVVQLNKIIQNDFFVGSTPPLYLYHFSFPEFEPIADFTKDENDLYKFDKHSDTLKLFVTLLKDFYEKTKFHSFFKAHNQYYDTMTTSVRKVFSERDYAKFLEEYYGEEHFEYNLVLTPLLHNGGYGPSIKTNKGLIVFAIVGPRSYSENISKFDADNILSYYVFHEFSHSFCNPIVRKYYSQLVSDSCLIRPILDEQNKQGYGGDWETCLYEHLVRANEIVLTKIALGEAVSDKVYKRYYEDKKWIYLKGLVPIIENLYLVDRESYKTQDDLMIKIIDYFNEEKYINCH